MKYSVLNESRQLFASKYRPYLPSEAELRAELDRERSLVAGELPRATSLAETAVQIEDH